MFASEIKAPVESVIVPWMVADAPSCAFAPSGAIMAMTRIASHPHLKQHKSPCFRLVDAPLIFNCSSTAKLLIQASIKLFTCRFGS
jgi:hypothetical protein